MWLSNDQLQDYYFLVYFTMFSPCNHEMLSSITLKQLFTKHTTKYHIKFNNLFILIMFNYTLIVWCHATMAYESKFQTSHHLFRLKTLNIDLVIKFNVKHTFDYNYQTSKSHKCKLRHYMLNDKEVIANAFLMQYPTYPYLLVHQFPWLIILNSDK